MTPFQKLNLWVATVLSVCLVATTVGIGLELKLLRKRTIEIDSRVADLSRSPFAETAGETAITKEYLLSLGFEPSSDGSRMYLKSDEFIVGFMQTFGDKSDYEITVGERDRYGYGSLSAHVKDRNHLNQWLNVLGISK